MRRITVPEDAVPTLFGTYDENLKHFESVLGVRIRTQGNELVVDGDNGDPDKLNLVVNQLAALMREGFKVSTTDVKTLPVIMRQFALGEPAVWGVSAAGALISTLPVALIFLLFQRMLMSGLAAGAVAGAGTRWMLGR